jgi:hypothetical protein
MNWPAWASWTAAGAGKPNRAALQGGRAKDDQAFIAFTNIIMTPLHHLEEVSDVIMAGIMLACCGAAYRRLSSLGVGRCATAAAVLVDV